MIIYDLRMYIYIHIYISCVLLCAYSQYVMYPLCILMSSVQIPFAAISNLTETYCNLLKYIEHCWTESGGPKYDTKCSNALSASEDFSEGADGKLISCMLWFEDKPVRTNQFHFNRFQWYFLQTNMQQVKRWGVRWFAMVCDCGCCMPLASNRNPEIQKGARRFVNVPIVAPCLTLETDSTTHTHTKSTNQYKSTSSIQLDAPWQAELENMSTNHEQKKMGQWSHTSHAARFEPSSSTCPTVSHRGQPCCWSAPWAPQSSVSWPGTYDGIRHVQADVRNVQVLKMCEECVKDVWNLFWRILGTWSDTDSTHF